MQAISFIGKPLPLDAANSHFCFVGSTGSGKTVSIRILMQSAFPYIGKGYGHRAVVYDAKRDMIPVLSGIVDPKLITALNPFDKRSVAWDMARDITTAANALQLATTLIPPEKNASQPFFGDAARHLLAGVVTTFILLSDKRAKDGLPRLDWTLRDVIWTMFHKDALIEVLKQTDETKHLVELYFSHEGTAQNIMSTVATKLAAFSIIAALWHAAYEEGRKISLNEWLQGETILVLGNDHTNRAALDALNQVIFKRISELILDQDDIPQQQSGCGVLPRRTWVVFDEFVRAGKLEGMVELATEGRSKGAAVVLGFQDIDGARAVYGKEVAEEIIAQCSNIAILRLQSPETAEWASRLFGSHEKVEKEVSENESESDSLGVFGLLNKGNTRGMGTTWRKQIRQAVLSSEFMNLPMTNTSNGLHGVLFSPYFAKKEFLQEHTIPADILFRGLSPKGSGVVGVKRRDGTQQFLKALQKADWERLGLLKIYRALSGHSEDESKEQRQAYLKHLAIAARKGLATEQERNEVSQLSKEDKIAVLRFSAENEFAEIETAEKETQELRQNLAALWVRRGAKQDELALVATWDDETQQAFYALVERASGKEAKYVPPTSEGEENSGPNLAIRGRTH